MPTLSLLVQSGPLRGQNFPLGHSQTIGRASDCDFILDGYTRVSRHRARLERSGEFWMVVDENSTPGLRVE